MAVPQVMTPREIVSELDRYIVGQHEAKRAVAIALRNRWRRQNVAPELRDEIAPKNILMIGPTGVGKTEIARRLARLAQAPFVKVEASRYTEVGYVGRDVESMIRDLAEIAVKMVRDEARDRVAVKARENAEERLLDLLFPVPTKVRRPAGITPEGNIEPIDNDSHKDTREKLRKLLNGGHLDDREVELEVSANAVPNIYFYTPQGMEEMGLNMQQLMNQLMPKKTRTRKVKIPEALELTSISTSRSLRWPPLSSLRNFSRVSLCESLSIASTCPSGVIPAERRTFDGAGNSRSSNRSSAFSRALTATRSRASSRTILTAISARSRIIDSTSRPT